MLKCGPTEENLTKITLYKERFQFQNIHTCLNKEWRNTLLKQKTK